MATAGTDGARARGMHQLGYPRVVAALLVILAASGCGRPAPETDARPVRVAREGSASPDRCRLCHRGPYSSWQASFHRTMTTEASPDTARFVADGVPPPATWGDMRITARDGRLWALTPDPDHRGPGPRPVIDRPVALITGSHHQQVFWYEVGRSRVLGRFPLTYLVDERRWIPRGAAFLQPAVPVLLPGAGLWNQVCISCHTTGGEARVPSMYAHTEPEDLRADSRVAEFGVSCEACHGPGAAHAGAPRSVSMTTAAKLDPRRSVEVCGQCHSVWEWHTRADEEVENQQGPRFRPGAVLADSRFVARPASQPDAPRLRELLRDDPDFVREAFWPDGTIAVAGREYNGLVESACFDKAREPGRTMTCLSCHAVHQQKHDPRSQTEWASGQLTVEATDDGACQACHPALARRQEAHTHHAAGSPGSRCVNCHMPYTAYGLMKTTRSHRITSPDVAAARATGRPDACSLCHVDKPLSWTAERLAAWYGRPRSATSGASAARESALPAAIEWALAGDAQQRAVVADALGRPEAHAASGDAWAGPALATLLDDPYPAVRFIAARSLRRLAPDTVAGYDFLARPEPRREAARRALDAWRARSGAQPAGLADVLAALSSRRNDRRVALRE